MTPESPTLPVITERSSRYARRVLHVITPAQAQALQGVIDGSYRNAAAQHGRSPQTYKKQLSIVRSNIREHIINTVGFEEEAGRDPLSVAIIWAVDNDAVETYRLPETYLDTLTAREREIAQWVIYGYNDNAICEQLYIAPTTVRVHRVNIYDKLRIPHENSDFTKRYTLVAMGARERRLEHLRKSQQI
ncbi:MAG TPA: helix-turn-helix transcriptional regulator [Candidatus Saccharimonadales bacterium]|nr:helix-turn-helix transcriptional regulator [Candidatus Saccharimonadales bacterium]